MFSSKDLFFTPAVSTGYTVSKSLRFRKSATAYLSRSYSGGAGNTTTYTLSMWVKRGQLYASGGTQDLFNPGTNTTFGFGRIANDELGGNLRGTSGTNYFWNTSAVFRDVSSWYHIVLAIDTTQTTLTNQVKLYINGVLQSITGTACPQNTAQLSTATRYIGTDGGGGAYLDGYIAETYFIDGSQKAATDFGAYDTNGIWQPAAYTGSYGTNGFYLKFTDVGATSGSNTGYGKDFAGTNYWTTNNFGTTSTLTTYDSMLDSPTNAAGDIGNYCVLNPLDALKSSSASISNANLTVSPGTTGKRCPMGTFGMSSGKWYFEVTISNRFADGYIGVCSVSTTSTDYPGASSDSWSYYGGNGNKVNGGTSTAYGTAYVNTDVVGVAVDMDNAAIYFGKQTSGSGSMVWQNSGDPTSGSSKTGAAFTNLTGYTVAAVFGDDSTSTGGSITFDANFGQRPFSATIPSGYSPLTTQNLTTPTITNGASYMAAVTYTGTGGSQTVTTTSTNSGNNPLGTTFKPDFAWVKTRSAVSGHVLQDVIRGVTQSNTLATEATGAEGAYGQYGYISAFNADGITVATGSSTAANTNASGTTYVGWQWKAGGTGVSNTSGSIASTVSANTSAGFSVVTYTGTGANATVGHGLGVAPSMVICKSRGTAGTNWGVWHTSIANTEYLLLNTTAAKATAATAWNSTTPTSTLVSLGSSSISNDASTMVMYCFAPVSGYSAFSSYTGNGSADGPFVYTGFRPRWILIKRTDAVNDWYIQDTSTNTYNVIGNTLLPNSSAAEASYTLLDALSNGFKLRNTFTSHNASGGTYIYAAFAENPFKISRAR